MVGLGPSADVVEEVRHRAVSPPPSSTNSIVMRANKLRATKDGAIHVYGVGTLWLNDEARRQLGVVIGMGIEARLHRAESTERAQAVNEKLARVPKAVVVRVRWRWTTTERTHSLAEPEGIVTGIEAVETVRQGVLGANA
jgi:hypothetical protein